LRLGLSAKLKLSSFVKVQGLGLRAVGAWSDRSQILEPGKIGRALVERKAYKT
jgi:hypothetical protein